MTIIIARLLIQDGDIEMAGEVSGVAGSGTAEETEIAMKIIEGIQKVLLEFKKPDGTAYAAIRDFPSTGRSNQTGS